MRFVTTCRAVRVVEDGAPVSPRHGPSRGGSALRVQYEPREEIDVAKVAEVLIRIALRTAGDQPVGQSGAHLRRLLAAER